MTGYQARTKVMIAAVRWEEASACSKAPLGAHCYEKSLHSLEMLAVKLGETDTELGARPDLLAPGDIGSYVKPDPRPGDLIFEQERRLQLVTELN